MRSNKDTRSGALSGTQNADPTSIMSDAASAHQTAQLAWMILVSLALRTHITETLPIANHLSAQQNS